MQGFTTNPYETKESLLLRMNEVLVGGVSAGTLMGAINVIHDTRVYLNACEYGLRTRSESAAHAKLQVLAATLEKVRSLVSNQAFSPDVQSEIRDALYADFAGGEPGCQDGDMLVHWRTLQPHSAGRLGSFWPSTSSIFNYLRNTYVHGSVIPARGFRMFRPTCRCPRLCGCIDTFGPMTKATCPHAHRPMSSNQSRQTFSAVFGPVAGSGLSAL